MKVALLLLAAILFSASLRAQTGVGTTSPHGTAVLDVSSTTKGLLPPRMTAAQRAAIDTPANGLLVFDTDSSSLFIYNKPLLAWQRIRPVAGLESLIAGTAAGDVLVWNGSAWVVTPKCNLFTNFYRDRDGDGFGDPFTPYLGCTAPTGFVATGTDCNDTSATIKPGAVELCNGVDDNCDGIVDNGASCATVANATTSCVNGACVVNCLPGYADCDGNPANGCETNLNNSSNCGNCNTSCNLPNAIANCIGGQCTIISCAPGFANCDGNPANGCEVNITNSAAHCGGCNLSCAVPNAVTACVNNTCVLVSCLPGYVNQNGITADGCECAVTNANDIPDAIFSDTNCDGIDGTESNAVFVAPSGNNSNSGTKSAPKQTITAAITTAAAQGKKQILIAAGTYNELITLSNSISLFGGYTAGSWVRNGSNTVTVTGGVVSANNHHAGIIGSNLTDTLYIDRITITTGNATAPGASSYGIRCEACPKLIVRNCAITTGNGAAGTQGASGTAGSPGAAGNNGAAGSCNSAITAPGGSGGFGPCNNQIGGTGGQGGNPSGGGWMGAAGTGGAAGGSGGGFSGAGVGGAPGASGTSGTNGTAGTVAFTSGYFAAGSGSNGTDGSFGRGGGGGGGGGGENCSFPCIEGTGNGGGGGGGGGCGGTLGAGGTGGGASIGVLLISSTGAVVQNTSITTGNGGAGGGGGNGGTGGAGGAGGSGGNACTLEVGAGGNGGAGGAGGRGGAGAGGNGGASCGILLKATTITATGNTISAGTAGAGGAGGTGGGGPSAAASGTAGASGNTVSIP